MGCVYCGCVPIPGEAICPECIVEMPVNQNADFDPWSDEEIGQINDELLLAVVRDDPEVELKPEFLEEVLNQNAIQEPKR